jgi:hypothetical protein
MTLLDEVLGLTERVHEAIQAGDWLHASELEQVRRARLEQLVAAGREEHGSAVADGEPLRATLETLQQRSLAMLGEVHHHRRRILREATTIKTGQDAAQAYRNA